MPGRRYKVMTSFDTRPEAINMAPIICALDRRENRFEQVICTNAQHHEMLNQVLTLIHATRSARE